MPGRGCVGLLRDVGLLRNPTYNDNLWSGSARQ